MVAAISVSSARRSASLFTTASSASMLAIATSDQWVSLRRSLEREVEQRRQHHRGELGRDPVDPVEWLVARQAVEHAPRCARGSSPSMLARLVGATIGATVLRCAVWRGGSMRMKLGSSWPLRLVGDLDAAQLRGRGIGRGVELDLHDVGVAGHRPIGPVGALGVAMDRILGAAAARNAAARYLRDKAADRRHRCRGGRSWRPSPRRRAALQVKRFRRNGPRFGALTGGRRGRKPSRRRPLWAAFRPMAPDDTRPSPLSAVTPASGTARRPSPAKAAAAALVVGALGVVFGDIGTSPLYALRETFTPRLRHDADAASTCWACCRSCSGR